ncbi:hypothetical protein EG68_02946 [Paragonimus skrjabini miyazakii]|uniref:Cytosolic fatty-acid binding proteins domain-containing protein n=1 Tax=Paragonimus skrjabini miyazakii TaxID=59628 RepID=A0A8S9YXC7_9TREM|nr:hypothetical protein EG68_02946 [Paragonimus skrjabini miyazakii]
MSEFVGRWSLVKSENYEKLLERLGQARTARRMSAATNQDITIAMPQPDRMSIISESSLGRLERTFNLDEEFEFEDTDGVRVMALIKLEGAYKLVETQHRANADLLITRELRKDRMIMTVDYGEVRCVREYDRQ